MVVRGGEGLRRWWGPIPSNSCNCSRARSVSSRAPELLAPAGELDREEVYGQEGDQRREADRPAPRGVERSDAGEDEHDERDHVAGGRKRAAGATGMR
jgi:hypothetical protein